MWEKAEKYPLFGHLRNKQHYILKAIKSPSALLEEIIDESLRICDVQPYFALFRISERPENESEDINLNKNINSLIGKKLDDFKTLKNPEVLYALLLTRYFTFFVNNNIELLRQRKHIRIHKLMKLHLTHSLTVPLRIFSRILLVKIIALATVNHSRAGCGLYFIY